MELGFRIRSVRKENGLSLEELADKSGVALATLSRIENGKGSGTFRTHRRIAGALGLPIIELYRGLQEPDEEAALLESSSSDEAETFTYDEKASAILLARQVTSKQMLPQLIVLQPGGKTSLEQYPHGTERWIFVLDGMIRVTFGAKIYSVAKEGTLYLKASIPHFFENLESTNAKMISVTSPAVL